MNIGSFPLPATPWIHFSGRYCTCLSPHSPSLLHSVNRIRASISGYGLRPLQNVTFATAPRPAPQRNEQVRGVGRVPRAITSARCAHPATQRKTRNGQTSSEVQGPVSQKIYESMNLRGALKTKWRVSDKQYYFGGKSPKRASTCRIRTRRSWLRLRAATNPLPVGVSPTS